MVLHHREPSTGVPLAAVPNRTMVEKWDINSLNFIKAYRGPERSMNSQLKEVKKELKGSLSISSFSQQGNNVYFSEGMNSFILPPRGQPVVCKNKFNNLID